MLTSLRTGYANYITSASYLLVLLVALRAETRGAWLLCLGLISLVAFLVWMSSYRRSRAIADTPTSRIASAAQGYVELYGYASASPEFRIAAKSGSMPCVWFRCVTYRRGSDNKWRVVDRSVSDSLFEMSDGTGSCMVDPDHAEVISTNRRTWYEGDYKHVEEQLLAGDGIYVLGEFTTLGGAHSPLDHEGDVKALLAEWKMDHPVLLERFDLNGDGQLDMQEWELARRAAAREISRQHRELRLQSGVHVMRRPANGGLFLLSNLSPQSLKRKYAWWSRFHLAVFVAGIGAAGWIATQHGMSGAGTGLW